MTRAGSNTEAADHGCPSWDKPPDFLFLREGEIHIWCASLGRSAAQMKGLFDPLTKDERARARRFFFEKDTRGFIVARGLLRLLLGRYLRVPPNQLIFTANRYGKPALTRGAGEPPAHFNLSHAGGLVYYAISKDREVGVDLECLRPDIHIRQLAKQFFSPQETRELLALPDDLQCPAFFTCWTRKEAYIKARGDGLSRSLASFSVSLAPGSPARLLATPDDPAEASRWTMAELPALPGYVAAIAYAGPPCRLYFWQWPD